MLYDVFNGDADGLCALHQLRLAEPAESRLVTGVKRDIGLLARIRDVAVAGDRVTALDISVEKNAAAVSDLLDRGVAVRWFDHHFPGELPRHPNFEPHIDITATVCTSLLVDRHLSGRYRAWAVAAAFGDNLNESARAAAAPLDLTAAQLDALCELGEGLNYNGYGESVADLHFPPEVLYQRLKPYADPFAFIAEAPEFRQLRQGYAEDMARAAALAPQAIRPGGAVYVLPDAAWARRVSGVFANNLATRNPGRAHALLTASSQGDYVVSVRAPVIKREGADGLCRRFGGGGRKAAAGINALPATELDAFIAAFDQVYPG